MAVPDLLGEREGACRHGLQSAVKFEDFHDSVSVSTSSRTHRGMTPTHPTPLDLATCVEHSLHLSLDRFDLSAARLYGITVVDPEGIPTKADGSLRITFLAEHADVYELLEAPTSAISKMFDAAVVLTCGWAAPQIGRAHV